MINLIEIFFILIIHFIGDFVFQTDKMAQGKSKNWEDLLNHTMRYTICWIPFLYWAKGYNGIEGVNLLGLFLPITFIAHTITDYFTSRLNSKLWQQGKVHWFFVSIKFDQILHYLQLFLTYYLLTK